MIACTNATPLDVPDIDRLARLVGLEVDAARSLGLPHARVLCARDAHSAGASAPVGYLLKCFPRLSETFILNEVLELERQGLDLRVYSLNEPQEPVRHRLASQVRTKIQYLPFPLLRTLHRHALAHCLLPPRRQQRRHPDDADGDADEDDGQNVAALVRSRAAATDAGREELRFDGSAILFASHGRTN